MKNAINTVLGWVLLFVLCVAPLTGMASEGEGPGGSNVDGTGDFVLRVEEGRLSLHAQQASVHEILQEIGRQMAIDIIGNLPSEEDETVTVEFEQLPLVEALPRLSGNYGYQKATDGKTQRVTKLFVLPKGQALDGQFPSSIPFGEESQVSDQGFIPDDIQDSMDKEEADRGARPEPFKFSFDPGADS